MGILANVATNYEKYDLLPESSQERGLNKVFQPKMLLFDNHFK